MHEFGPLAPLLGELSESDFQLFKNRMSRHNFEKGKLILKGDNKCSQIYFIEKGSVRVFKMTDEGKEITLYRMAEGEACILSVSCAMLPSMFSSMAEVDVDSTLISVPYGIYEQLLARNPSFRDIIFKRIFSILNQVIALSEEIAFHSIKKRVASKILDLQALKNSNVLSTTHEEIALELGSAREVVSRILKNMTQDQVIIKTRGRIEILDEKKLKEIALG